MNNYKSLARDISTLLENAPNLANVPNFKLVVFLDGIEHLEEPTIAEWIPQILPKGVRLIVSTYPNSKLSRYIRSRSDKIDSIRVEELNWTERKQITTQILKNFGKTLSDASFDNQLDTIASKREANNPTFLKLLCTEMSKFGIFEKVHEQLNVLSQSMESMLETVALSVEDEVGIDFMRKVVPLLVASSHFGLTELRLLKLIQRIGIESASLTLFLFLNGLEVFLQPLDENYGVVQLKTGIFQVSTVRCRWRNLDMTNILRTRSEGNLIEIPVILILHYSQIR